MRIAQLRFLGFVGLTSVLRCRDNRWCLAPHRLVICPETPQRQRLARMGKWGTRTPQASTRSGSLPEQRGFEPPSLFALPMFRGRLVSHEISTRSFPKNRTDQFSPTRFSGRVVPKTSGFRTDFPEAKDPKGEPGDGGRIRRYTLDSRIAETRQALPGRKAFQQSSATPTPRRRLSTRR
jgi:hypothetical protein